MIGERGVNLGVGREPGEGPRTVDDDDEPVLEGTERRLWEGLPVTQGRLCAVRGRQEGVGLGIGVDEEGLFAFAGEAPGGQGVRRCFTGIDFLLSG